VAAEGEDFIVREAVILHDELTEVITFIPKLKLIARGEIYFDLRNQILAEPDRAQLFIDEPTAIAFACIRKDSTGVPITTLSEVRLAIGASLGLESSIPEQSAKFENPKSSEHGRRVGIRNPVRDAVGGMAVAQ